jgi:hypothetical protein
MPGLTAWDAYLNFVEGGKNVGQFANGQFVLLAAGPPHLMNFGGASQLGSGADVVYPLGLTQNVALSQNRAFSRIFEIGSERSFFIPGRTIGQLTLARVYFHGASLLRSLYAYYQDGLGSVTVPRMPLMKGPNDESLWPFISGAGTINGPPRLGQLHNVRIPPGYDNLFINLASDLFSQPIGLLMLVRDSELMNLGGIYLEQCYVPTHMWTVDSNGLIIQESVGIQFERIVPIRTNAITLISGLQASQNPYQSSNASTAALPAGAG